jgi:hypothetical protein
MDMAKTKSEIREIVLDILFGRERTEFGASQFGNLALGVAEVIARRDAITQNRMSDGRSLELSNSDKMIMHEVFWDLFIDRVITIGLDCNNREFPWFRLHSEAEENVKKSR